jgi:OmpA-OmpF porin, OOP family
MLRKTLLLLLLAASLGASAQTNFYAGAELNATKAKLLGSSAGVGLFGGFSLNKTVGVELGYKNLGTFNYDGFPTDVQALQASLLISYPITEKTTTYGRLGVTKLNAAVQDSAFKKDAIGAHVGVGVSYEMSEKVKLRAELANISKVANQIKVSALIEF